MSKLSYMIPAAVFMLLALNLPASAQTITRLSHFQLPALPRTSDQTSISKVSPWGRGYGLSGYSDSRNPAPTVSLPPIMIGRLRSNLDTAWVKVLYDYRSRSGSSCIDQTGSLYYAGTFKNPTNNRFGMYLCRYDTLGSQLWQQTLEDTSITGLEAVTSVLALPDSGVLVSGFYSTALSGYPSYNGVLYRFSKGGRLIYKRYYSPSSTVFNSIEELYQEGPNTVRATVRIGRQVWLTRFDLTTGRATSEQNMMVTSLIVLNPSMRPTPDGNYIISAYSTGASADTGYIAVVTPSGVVQRQIKMAVTDFSAPAVNVENYALIGYQSPGGDTLKIVRYSITNLSKSWEIKYVIDRTNICDGDAPFDFIFDGLGNAFTAGGLFCGFFALFDGAGMPYTGTTTGIAADRSKVYVVPNPAQGQVRFEGLSGASSVSFFDVTGRPVLSADVLPGAPVSITSLAKGMYVYRLLSARGESHFGRLVVE